MELRQLRYLVALADERHFTRAAARLHIAQPALSQQIRRLEDEVGVALVDRTTRHVSLTPAGEQLVGRARRALGEVDAACLSVNRLDAGPDIQLHPLLDEPLVALLAPGHRLAGRRRIDMAELRDERFVVFGEGGSLRRIVVQGAREAGFEPQLAFESTEQQRIRAMVAHGLGVALLPASEAEHAGPPVAAIPVRNPELERDVTLAWRANRRHSPAARAFLDLALGADASGRRSDRG